MIPEQILDQLERDDLPLYQKRGMLDRLNQKVGRMPEDVYQRYKAIETRIRQEIIQALTPSGTLR